MGQSNDKLRQKKLARQKKRRDGRSRAARDQAPGTPRTVPTSQARHWPVGPCYLSDGWYERGASTDVVVTRVHGDGDAIAAVVEVDLAGGGIGATEVRQGLREEHLPGEAARVSERTGRTMIEVAPAQAVAVLRAAAPMGAPLPEAIDDLLGDIDAAVAPLEVLTGAPDERSTKKPEGWFSRLVGKLVGSPGS